LIEGNHKRGREEEPEPEGLAIVNLNRDVLRIIADETGFATLKELSRLNKALYLAWKYIASRKYWWRMPEDKQTFDQVINSLIDDNNHVTVLRNVIISNSAQIDWLRQRNLWDNAVWRLRFAGTFNEPVQLPQGLLSVAFGYSFDQPVVLPEGLQSVTFGADYNQPVVLPQGILSVIFGEAFNQPVILPEGLQSVTFGYFFDQPVVLPEGLQSVKFGHRFNQPVVLPQGLQSVTFGFWFDQPVVLPQGLQSVKFEHCFNQPVVLPEGLQSVKFGKYFNSDIQFPNTRCTIYFTLRSPWWNRVTHELRERHDFVSYTILGD
jgi:hypothetical protein